MNCPYCKKEIESGSKFCTYCGTKLHTEVPIRISHQETSKINKEVKQTLGEKRLISVCRAIFYVTLTAFALSVLSKFVYTESIVYGCPSDNGYYEYKNSKLSDSYYGECGLIIHYSALFNSKISRVVSRSRHYMSAQEMNSDFENQRQCALKVYNERIDVFIIYMFLIFVAALVLYKYVQKLCTVKALK